MVLIPGAAASISSDGILLGYAQLTSVDRYQHFKRKFYLHPQGTSDFSAMLVSIYRTSQFKTHIDNFQFALLTLKQVLQVSPPSHHDLPQGSYQLVVIFVFVICAGQL